MWLWLINTTINHINDLFVIHNCLDVLILVGVVNGRRGLRWFKFWAQEEFKVIIILIDFGL